MDYKSIELSLLQLEEAFAKSRSNIYSDKNKEVHFFELYDLFQAIKNSNYQSYSNDDLFSHNLLLDYIFKGLEYLDNSTLNIIPFEILSCLEYALNDWIDSTNIIIVTSLSNKNLDFYFEAFYGIEKFNQINFYIQKQYNLKITHRLVRISLPKVLSRDYLSTVVLYHELGHFVDIELQVSTKLLYQKYGVKDHDKYTRDEAKYYYHFGEYFADLFAAQYINNASNLFLSHITTNDEESQTHPKTSTRIEVVDKFLKGENCSELNHINAVLTGISKPEFKIRHKMIEISKSDFLNLIPQDFNNVEELHYVFKLGWDFWDDSSNNYLKDFNARQKYHIINNLIEKSISNFTVERRWKEICAV